LSTPPPLGLYVHLPWCVRKCPYCDFNSHRLQGALPEAAYLDALLADLEDEWPLVGGRVVATVFFGGGTPSLFRAESLARVLDWLRDRDGLAADAEVTLEANPGTVERGRFADYRAAGINRVSLGVQSFDPRQLARLGRIHGPQEVAGSLDELARAGLDNFNLDLMYGLPGQSVDEACEDLAAAIAAGPAHISHYQLTLEPNTLFWHEPPTLPDDDATWEMQIRCGELLAVAGYEHYEVSAHAADGRRCAHNVNYWSYGDYVGVGAGAHGKLTTEDGTTILRRSKLRHPTAYLAAAGGRVQTATRVGPGERLFEFMLNALRLRDGFDATLFEARTGLSFDLARPRLIEAGSRGLIECPNGAWRPTALGRRFLNDLQGLFLPATAEVCLHADRLRALQPL
jgi:oxygen-independent coproporphyrinogen-3 oxidase